MYLVSSLKNNELNCLSVYTVLETLYTQTKKLFEKHVSVLHFTCLNKHNFQCRNKLSRHHVHIKQRDAECPPALKGTSSIHNDVCDLRDADWLNKCKLILCCHLYVNRFSISTDAPKPFPLFLCSSVSC